MRAVLRRTARAVALAGTARAPELVTIRRDRPGAEVYWVTPGGGVEPDDADLVAAMRREVAEEIGGQVADPVLVFVHTEQLSRPAAGTPAGIQVAHFFACRLLSCDPALRHGPEVDAPNGSYATERVPFTRDGLAALNLVPHALAGYLAANIEALVELAALDHHNP